MHANAAIAALSALAQDTRLGLYRLLVQRGPDGMPAGEIAKALHVPASSLSFHLAHLSRAQLIAQRRVGRQLIYSADFAAMNDLIAYLTENCCGAAEACGPVCAPASPAEQSATTARRSR